MATKEKLIYNHSHHLLEIDRCDAELDVLNFSGQESLSKPFHYRIEFTSSNHHLTREQVLLKKTALTLRAYQHIGFVYNGVGKKGWVPQRIIQGIATHFERVSHSKDQTHYALILQPRIALLERSHYNAIYQYRTVPELVEKILRERHNMRGQDFLFTLQSEYPIREQIMQYGEDDLRFISRLLAEVGIWYRITTDTRLKIDVIEFYDGKKGYEYGLSLPAVPPSGQQTDGVEAVWALQSRYQVVEKQVSTRDYNYRHAYAEMDALVDVSFGDETTYGESYHFGENYLTQGDRYHHFPEPETGYFYARIRHERYLNQQAQFSGITGCTLPSPGKVLAVTGGPEVEEAFSQGVLITEMHCSAQRDHAFECHFKAMPSTVFYRYRPEPPPKPIMAGTLPARIISSQKDDIYGHIDKNGCYQVKMLFDRGECPKGYDSMWVRQARLYAGDNYGLHLPLIIGTEVAIAFEDGSPDRPYIAGALHDSAHPDPITIRNYRRNVLRTPSNNKIRLEDARGQEHIKISTEYGGKSQLNLGHLVDSERQKRGAGFELRTDDWGAVRAGKGILLAAHAQPKAAGQQLSMEAIKRQLSDALTLAESLSTLLQQAQVAPLDHTSQQHFLNATEQLQEPVIVAGAPGGIALSSAKHLQLSANGNQISTAGGNSEISALKRLALVAKKGLVAFAHELGMKLIAATGKVEIQAQTGALDINAHQRLAITSTEDEVIISAKKRILLHCGRSYISLTENQIEHGCCGSVDIKSAEFNYLKGIPHAVPYQNYTACEKALSQAEKHHNALVALS